MASPGRSASESSSPWPRFVPPSSTLPLRRRRPRKQNHKLILIADDVRDARDLYAAYFESRGFRAITARDGNEALALAQSLRPHVIVTDLAMPHLDGITVTRRLKKDPHTRSIPIIVLTGYPETAIDGGALEAGAAVFLTKPCLPEDLEVHVRRLLDPRHSSRS
jgi:two-component system, cell cycle response regulator DivK